MKIAAIKDRISIRYGRLTVIKFAGQTWDNRVLWFCKCDCGKEVTVLGQSLQTKNTQSCGCLHKEMVGKNNPNYKNGEHCGVHIKAILKLKEWVRKRDNYICQKCGKTQEQNLKEYGKIFDVHHIDGDDTNNVIENMITLCRSCHGNQIVNV